MKKAIKIFVSYSSLDASMFEELERHLTAIFRFMEHEVEIWSDKKIMAGQRWQEALIENLEDSDIILVLISASYLSSEWRAGRDLPAILKLEKKGKTVVPVILSPCFWQISPGLEQLQVLPKDGISISERTVSEREKAYLEVAKAIYETVILASKAVSNNNSKQENSQPGASQKLESFRTPPPQAQFKGSVSDEIYELIRNGNIEKAIQLYLETAVIDSPEAHHAVMLFSRWNRLKRDIQLHTISYETGNMEQNRLTMALLELISNKKRALA